MVSLQSFAWPRSALATLRHPTLPWFDRFAPEIELPATPLVELRSSGTRDRLSLLGQYAAHVAFLQFAGIGDSSFDPDEWAVVRKRGSDCRLIRTAARSADADRVSAPLHDAQQFAEAIGAPALDVLRQSWTRAESIFAEVYRRLRSDAAADVRWLQRSAAGEIIAPGPDALSLMCSVRGPHEVPRQALEALSAYASLDRSMRLIVIGSDFPIQRYAALASVDESLCGSSLEPGEVADRLLERFASPGHVVIVCGALDDDSRRVVDILGCDRETACTHRTFVLSTRLSAQRALEEMLETMSEPRAWLERFVSGDRYAAYLNEGALPVDEDAFARAPEPRRLYIAALALLGTRIPRSLACEFLRQFLFEQSLDELVIAGVTSLDDNCFWFASDAVRAHCAGHVPAAARPALCRAAASVADTVRSALLLIESGDALAGVERLESVSWMTAEETIRTLSEVPRSVLTPVLATALANALIDSGRYADVRELAPVLPEPQREVLFARCERRTGEYASALARIERSNVRGVEAELLHAELLRLTGRLAEARNVLDRIRPETPEETIRVDYDRAVLALDAGEEPAELRGRHYFASRLATYRALLHGNFDAAAEFARQSFAAARGVAERIDACLDRVFASFSSGRWSETRALALEALAMVDEAQGDRAAAGILFTLAFLEADDGRWSSAAQHIARLRSYYANDGSRLAEVDLLSAQLEFSRAQFHDARRLAAGLVDRAGAMPQIREAAALVIDEIDWIEKRSGPLRSAGSRNRELDDRHRVMRARRGLPAEPPVDVFLSALLGWESAPGSTPPHAETRSEALKLFRSALGIGRHAVALAIAEDLSIAMPDASTTQIAPDLEMLRTAAAAEYPFRPDIFDRPWCHATRNRLGQWSQDGSRTFEADALDRAAASPDLDWLRCSDRELLFIEGSTAWPEASRDAMVALFRTRAENHRLRRILEQEEQPARSKGDGMDGAIGESPGMRCVFALIERIGQRDVPVCILGESGTGKELAGRAIHRASARRHKTFTAINCAALPENLIESELFGHVRGAFTGADRDRTGLIESSDGGTLFLDEIGEMPLAAQAKLLRFLQDGEFRRVGEPTNRNADVRIVSATNRKLEAAVEEGRFREDLYYRIRGVEIVLPPLRDRGEDVLLLARHFLATERARHRSGPHAFSPEAEALLRSYPWPGNVRELQNTIRAAHAMAGENREIDIDHLPERIRNVKPAKAQAGSYQDAVAHFRRDLIEKSLAAAAGNQNRAAAMLKISRQALAYQIRELGIMVGKTSPRAHLSQNG